MVQVKAGDDIRHKETGKIFSVVGVTNDKIKLKYGLFIPIDKIDEFEVISNIELDYQQLYEQQKHRADEAEKRADAAEGRLKKIKDTLVKSRASLSVDIFRNNRPEDKQYFQFCSDVIALIEKLERGKE